MKSPETESRCPYLEEVVMVCCHAYPVRKMVPRDRILTRASHCFEGDFQGCPFYQEIMARMGSFVAQESVPPCMQRAAPKGESP
jgi:hypothetical protein